MGLLLQADFKTKLAPELHHFDPKNIKPDYQNKIFMKLFTLFPQFKAHVAMHVDRNYCVVVNDEDHANPESLLGFLKPEEVLELDKWILSKKNRPLFTRK